jgi:hypothetical protein
MFNLCQRWFNLIGGATGINWQLLWIEDEFQSGQNFRILNILSVRSRDDMDVNNNGNIPIQHDQHLCSLLTAACHRMLLTKYGFESRMHESKTLKSWTKTSLGPWTVSQRPGLYILLQDHEAGDNGLPPWLMGILSRSGKQWWKVHEGTVSGDNVHSHWFLAISCFWCAFFFGMHQIHPNIMTYYDSDDEKHHSSAECGSKETSHSDKIQRRPATVTATYSLLFAGWHLPQVHRPRFFLAASCSFHISATKKHHKPLVQVIVRAISSAYEKEV